MDVEIVSIVETAGGVHLIVLRRRQRRRPACVSPAEPATMSQEAFPVPR